jgi:probable phosphoglycerate mutase
MIAAVNQELRILETELYMKLYFIRHGQTDWNKARKIQGSCDIELNTDGRKQADVLCRKLKEENTPITRIYTSNQKRAHQTAAILSKATNLELITINGLQEVYLGLWEGLSWSEVRVQYPTEYEAWYHNRRYDKSHCGESYQEVVDRAMKAIHTIIKENSNDIAIVTHNAVIMCLQCYLTNTPFEEMKSFKSTNTAITMIDSEIFLKEL